MSCYDIGIKLSENKTGPMFYTFLVSIFSTVFHLGFFYYFYRMKGEVPFFGAGISALSVFTGLSLTLINVCVIMMIIRGGALSVGFPMLLVTNLVITTLAGVFFFHEAVNLRIMIGVLCAIAAIALLSH